MNSMASHCEYKDCTSNWCTLLHNHISTSLVSSLCMFLFSSVQEKHAHLFSTNTFLSKENANPHTAVLNWFLKCKGCSVRSPLLQNSQAPWDRDSPEVQFWKAPPPKAWNPLAFLSLLSPALRASAKAALQQLLRPVFSTCCTECLAVIAFKAPQNVLLEKDQAYLLALDLLREKHLHPPVERNCKTGRDGWLKHGFNSQLYNLGTTQTLENKYSILTPKQPAVLLLADVVHLWSFLC